MSNNFITKISPNVRIIVLMLLVLSLFFAKSIYLISLITTLVIILAVITDKKVNIYVNTLKRMTLLLLFFLVTYIIIFRQYDLVSIVVFAYKLTIATILIKIFILNIEFSSMHEGLYGAFLPLKIFNVDIEKFSLEVTLSFYFINLLITSKEKIKKLQISRGKKIANIKNFAIPILIHSINQFDKLQENLKIKFYKLNYKKSNFTSKMILVLFILMFIVCVFKEVM